MNKIYIMYVDHGKVITSPQSFLISIITIWLNLFYGSGING